MSFSGITGLDPIIALLKRSLRSGRMSHAYLFEGIEGCGKRKTAIALVEALFCGGEDACGSCPSCRKIRSLQHPDLHIMEPEGAFIKIDQVRDLQKALSLRPFEAPKKACIIDGADRMNPASGNALLKTLEEPPGEALLILISSNPGNVLPTIQSRCQHLHFPALPESAIEEHLVGLGHPPESARVAASLAGGSMGKAMEICHEESLGNRADFFRRLSKLSLGEIKPVFSLAEEISADKERTLEILELLSLFYRDSLLMSSESADVANVDLLPLIRENAERCSTVRLMENLQHVEDARQALNRNVNTRLALDVLFMRLADPLSQSARM